MTSSLDTLIDHIIILLLTYLLTEVTATMQHQTLGYTDATEFSIARERERERERERLTETSVGIDLKKTGGHLPKCLKFCPGIEVCGRFSLKNERL